MRPVTNNEPSSSALAKLAVAVDKYDCRIALAAQIDLWLRPWNTLWPSDQDRVNLLTIGYVLKMSALFSDVGAGIVLAANSTSMAELDIFCEDPHVLRLLGRIRRPEIETTADDWY